MPKLEESGCHGCRYGDWDADGCTCKLDGLLVWNPRRGCECRKADEDKPMTNGDRIRAMTDEELAEFFCQISQCCGNDASCSMCPIYDGCAQNVMCVERWLKQKVSEDD